MVFKRGGLFSEVVVRWVYAVFVFCILICCLVVDAGVWHGLFCFLTNNGIRVWYIDHISKGDNANQNVIERRIMSGINIGLSMKNHVSHLD